MSCGMRSFGQRIDAKTSNMCVACIVYIESISIHICISATVIYCILFAKET